MQVCKRATSHPVFLRSPFVTCRTSSRCSSSRVASPLLAGTASQEFLSVTTSKRNALTLMLLLGAASLQHAALAEQGIQASDYTVAAFTSQQYADKIQSLRQEAMASLKRMIESGNYSQLSTSLVLSPIDDIHQSVLYIPSALLKEGKGQEAVLSRKAYTDFMRELKKLDELALKAARYDADTEDVLEKVEKLDKTLDTVLKYVK